MPYGPQDEEYYARQRAKFEKEHPEGKSKPRNRRDPSRMIRRPTRATQPNEVEEAGIQKDVDTAYSQGLRDARLRDSSGDSTEYFTPNYQEHVAIALILSVIVVIVAWYARGKKASTKGNPLLTDPSQFVRWGAAWLVIGGTLLAMAVFRGTDKLAATFAWLIFVAVLLTSGVEAFDYISTTHKVHK